MGPLMLDCQGEELLPEEREMIGHPTTGGFILFSRNYHDTRQLAHLVSQVRDAARGDIVIAVDHEGGRVQRFRDAFTSLPAMGDISRLGRSNYSDVQIARDCGQIMAFELKQWDIDISFAPVLDVDGISNIIGDRSFSADPNKVIELARQLIAGMHDLAMPVTGKHFPGHGSVEADSHVASPIDDRSMAAIDALDLLPFKQLIDENVLDAIMPAHVIYPRLCDKPAGFSAFWMQTILRKNLGFDGVIFSDDLSMEGAVSTGSFVQRAEAAMTAGCDMVLVCNHSEGAAQVLDGLGRDFQQNSRRHRLVNQALPANARDLYQGALSRLQTVIE